MIPIAHRGNIDGPNPEKENHPDYIKKALARRYQVEIDVWVIDGKYVLGHDFPTYEVGDVFINCNIDLWLHAKNLEALRKLSHSFDHLNYFWHQTDDFVVTSRKYIWTYPGKELGPTSICVLPEKFEGVDFSGCAGVCSDFIQKYV